MPMWIARSILRRATVAMPAVGDGELAVGIVVFVPSPPPSILSDPPAVLSSSAFAHKRGTNSRTALYATLTGWGYTSKRTGGVAIDDPVPGALARSGGRYLGSELAISQDGLMGYCSLNGCSRGKMDLVSGRAPREGKSHRGEI